MYFGFLSVNICQGFCTERASSLLLFRLFLYISAKYKFFRHIIQLLLAKYKYQDIRNFRRQIRNFCRQIGICRRQI